MGDARAPRLAALGAGGRYYAPGVPDPYVALLEEALAALEPDDSALRARAAGPARREPRVPRARDRAILIAGEAQAMARRLGEPAALAAALMSMHATHQHIAYAPNDTGSRRRRSPSRVSSMTTSSPRSDGTGSSSTSSSSVTSWRRGGAGWSSRPSPTVSVSRSTATPHWPGGRVGWAGRAVRRGRAAGPRLGRARRARRRSGRPGALHRPAVRRPTGAGPAARAARSDRRAGAGAGDGPVALHWRAMLALAHVDAGNVTAARAAW